MPKRLARRGEPCSQGRLLQQRIGRVRLQQAGLGVVAIAGGPAVIVYVEVDDPQAYVKQATETGPTVVLPVTHLPGAQVTVAWLRDPQGNLLGLVKNRED